MTDNDIYKLYNESRIRPLTDYEKNEMIEWANSVMDDALYDIGRRETTAECFADAFSESGIRILYVIMKLCIGCRYNIDYIIEASEILDITLEEPIIHLFQEI
jgi:hypothetical protein